MTWSHFPYHKYTMTWAHFRYHNYAMTWAHIPHYNNVMTWAQFSVLQWRHDMGTLSVSQQRYDMGTLSASQWHHDMGTLSVSTLRHDMGTLSVLQLHHDMGTLSVSKLRHDIGTLPASQVLCACFFVVCLSTLMNKHSRVGELRRHDPHVFLTKASFGLGGLSLLVSVCLCVCARQPRACPCHNASPVQAGSPNLDKRCKTPWSRAVLFCLAIDLDLHGQI